MRGEGTEQVESVRQRWEHGTCAVRQWYCCDGKTFAPEEGVRELQLRMKLDKPRWGKFIFGSMQRGPRVITS